MHGVPISSILPPQGEDLLGSFNVGVPVATEPLACCSSDAVKVLARAGVVGQFDDPDDETSVEALALKPPRVPPVPPSVAAAPAIANRNPLEWLAAACGQELQHDDPGTPRKTPQAMPQSMAMAQARLFERRMSATTCSAMSNLLSLAHAQVVPTSNRQETLPDDHVSSTAKDMSNTQVQKRKPQKSWQERVDELVAFKVENGHLRLKQYAKGHEEEKQLGAWLANCRSRFRAGKLNPNKAATLREIGCEGFGGDNSDSDSNEEAEDEDDVSDVKGMDPPASSNNEDVYYDQYEEEDTYQRRPSNESFSTRSQHSSETPGNKRSRKSFEERIQEMRAFFLKYGHCHVMTRGEHKELGRWLSHTRTRARDGNLPPQHLELFNAMLSWDAAVPMKEDPPEDDVHGVTYRRNSATSAVSSNNTDDEGSSKAHEEKRKRAPQKGWDVSFQDLVAFKEKFGHVNCRIVKNDPNEQLGKWLASNRSRFRLGYLHDVKVEKLRRLGCTGFDPSLEGPALSHGQEHASQASHPSQYDAAMSLFASSNPKYETLARDEGSAMAAVEPPSSASAQPKRKRKRNSYETRVEHIKAFKEQHGHCRITFNPEDKHEEQLARWLASVRSRHRAGTLQPERSTELHALGCDGFEPSAVMPPSTPSMAVENDDNSVPPAARTATPSPPASPNSKRQRTKAIRQSWDDMFLVLQDYQVKHGVGCSVPKPEGEPGKLGRWLAFQRRQYLAGKLQRDRVEKLQEMGRTEFLDREDDQQQSSSVVMYEEYEE